MAIFKALTFDGVNSLDYGIYITGEAVYNAPERAVEMINIPGKNGALALDQGRFENIEVTYHAGCFADSQADFADKVMQFRNALASRYTYKRLTDEYHPDEYRLGLYKSGLDVDAVRYGTAGEFDIVFDCKPQRFLTDGDREILPTEWSDVQTESGELVTIESDGSLAVKSLEVSLEPIQAGSGEPSPDNVRPISGRTSVETTRTGKNLLPNTGGETVTANGITFTKKSDGSVTVNGTATANASYTIATMAFDADVRYTLNGCPSGGGSDKYNITVSGFGSDVGNGYTFAGDGTTERLVRIWVIQGQTVDNLTFYPMIRLASDTDATYEPYNGNTYTTALGRTVYGGTLDVVSGVLTVDKVMLEWLSSSNFGKGGATTVDEFFLRPSLAGVSGLWRDAEHIICSHAKNVESTSGVTAPYTQMGNGQPRIVFPLSMGMTLANFKTWLDEQQTNGTPLQVCYMLATPQTYQLTPQQISLLVGENHLWSDGEITVEYGVHPYYNPTPFASKPLIKVTGRGTLGIGEYILTITGAATQTLYIDCETMEIYTIEGTVPTGASSLVSINKNDFPVLEPGTNYISVGSGITAVTITPRWWRI